MEELQIVDPNPPSPKWFVPPSVAPPQKPLRLPPGLLKLRPQAGPSTKSKYTETVKLRFRTRFVRATAAQVSGIHPNIMLLHVLPSVTEQLVRMAVHLLPHSLRARFEASFPEWSLPSRLVLKRYKEGWDEEFDTEKATYDKVKPLQGIVVPKCHGELKYKGTRALLLSDIGGACLAKPEGALLDVTDLRRMLQEAFGALAQFGVLHDDIKLDNFHVVGDKVMVLDLERVNANLSDHRFAFNIKCDIEQLAEYYEDNQYCFWTDGFTMIDT